jgi:hypothetical protein
MNAEPGKENRELPMGGWFLNGDLGKVKSKLSMAG